MTRSSTDTNNTYDTQSPSDTQDESQDLLEVTISSKYQYVDIKLSTIVEGFDN